MNKDLSIIIVNYKSKRNLLLCLGSLKKFAESFSCEIIIVNNDKNESLYEVREKFSEVKIIEQGENIGFGSAINSGAKIAEGKILFLLNPDTEIISGNLRAVMSEFSEDKNLGILGSRIVDENGSIQPWIAGVKKSFWDLLKNNLGIKESQKIWKAHQKINADWVAATALFMKKDLFDSLGGFDKNIFMYFEDVDLCERARALNKKIIYFPNFVVRHINGGSFENKTDQKKYYYASQEYFFKKHCRKWEIVIVKLIRKLFYAL